MNDRGGAVQENNTNPQGPVLHLKAATRAGGANYSGGWQRSGFFNKEPSAQGFGRVADNQRWRAFQTLESN